MLLATLAVYIYVFIKMQYGCLIIYNLFIYNVIFLHNLYKLLGLKQLLFLVLVFFSPVRWPLNPRRFLQIFIEDSFPYFRNDLSNVRIFLFFSSHLSTLWALKSFPANKKQCVSNPLLMDKWVVLSQFSVMAGSGLKCSISFCPLISLAAAVCTLSL